MVFSFTIQTLHYTTILLCSLLFNHNGLLFTFTFLHNSLGELKRVGRVEKHYLVTLEDD